MKKFSLLAAILLGGCAQIQTLEGASLNTTQVYAAANAFDAVELTATNYLKLPVCVSGGPILCRNQQAAAAIVAAGRGGYQARRTLISACIAGTTSTACVSAYTTLTTAVTGLQNVFTQYGITKG